jgi:hypothetical protein
MRVMGFFLRAGSWLFAAAAVAIAAFVVHNAFFGPAPPAKIIAARTCPPPTPAAAPGAPVDDVVGLRPGFSVAEAQAMLLCRDPAFDFEFEPIWHTPVPARIESRQRMIAVRPQERIALGLAGEPGHELVSAIFQDIRYGETALTATPGAVAADLARHYGPPHDRQDNGARIDLWWLYGPDGKPIKAPAPRGADPLTAFAGWVKGSWEAGDCERHVTLDPLAPAIWSDRCGLSIHAQIDVRKDDPTRLARTRIVVIDQARLAAAVENYRERIGVNIPAR